MWQYLGNCKIESLLLQTTNRKWHMTIEYRQFRWPWVTFKVIHPLQSFSNGIFRTAVQHLTRFRLVQCVARSLCDTWSFSLLMRGMRRTSYVLVNKYGAGGGWVSAFRSAVRGWMSAHPVTSDSATVNFTSVGAANKRTQTGSCMRSVNWLVPRVRGLGATSPVRPRGLAIISVTRRQTRRAPPVTPLVRLQTREEPA